MVLCALLQASLVFGGGCWETRDATHWQFGVWWCVCVVKVSEVSTKVLAFTCTWQSGRSEADKQQQVSFSPLPVMSDVTRSRRYHLESCVVEERERFCWYGKSILSHRGTSRELSVIAVTDARGLV
jgi:hypothetical protein